MSIARRLISSSGGELEPFSFNIQTTTSGQNYELPLTAPNGNQPNILVNWGDGTEDTITNVSDVEKLHTYSTSGTYTIEIEGFLPGFEVNNNSTYRELYIGVNHWGFVGLRQIDFYGCSNLSTLPTDGSNNAINNEGLLNIRRFDETFRSTGLTVIPNGLFDFSPNVVSFTNTFRFSFGITSIPSGLFGNNTNVTVMAGTFNGLTGLTTIPSGLFSNCPDIQNFQSVFRNCRDLTSIPLTLFDNNQNVTTFANSFNMASTANDLIGDAPDIWNRTPEPFGEDCFAFCTGLNNFASIPNNFK